MDLVHHRPGQTRRELSTEPNRLLDLPDPSCRLPACSRPTPDAAGHRRPAPGIGREPPPGGTRRNGTGMVQRCRRFARPDPSAACVQPTYT
jgi:hypothetical protein